MIGDDRSKECKHCVTMISRRASVCPQCRNSVARFSGLVSFVRTGAWFVTATVSLGFAALEKWENLDLSNDLTTANLEIDKKEVEIAHEEVQAEVIEEMYAPPIAAAMTREQFFPR